MPRTRTSLLAVALAGTALASAAPALGASTTLAVEPAATRVAAYDGLIMWSRFDPASRTYSLVKSVDGGSPTTVRVAPRSGSPFDIDLGTNRSGATYAVYTRDGDIYRLDPATGSEVKITKLSSPTLAEREPTIQRGRIAFIRRDHGYDQLRIGDTTGASKGSKLVVKRRAIVYAELGLKHVVYLTTSPGPISDSGTRSLRIRNLSTGRDRQIYRAVSGGANFANVTRPTYDPSPEAFVWARTNNGSGAGNRIVRYTLRSSKLGYATGDPRYNATAWAGGRLGLAFSTSLDGGFGQDACSDAGVQYCAVGYTGPPVFNRTP